MSTHDSLLFNVIFEPGKGECLERTRDITAGSPYGVLPRPTREGYLFDGWFTAPEGDPSAQKVTSTDIADITEDIRLYAHWIKRKTAQRKSLFRKQMVWLFVILGLVAILAVTIPVVTYYVINSTTYTEKDLEGNNVKYYVRKNNGEYVMMRADGRVLFVNEDGCYTTDAGTLIKVDPSTGKYEIYAVVDTEGSEVVGVSNRILIFPQMTQATKDKSEDTIIGRIEVHNTEGTYTVYRGADTTSFRIEGFEESPLVSVDPTLIAKLCVASGYTISMQKLDTAKVREAGYAQYGFTVGTDGEGNQTVTSENWYRVTSRNNKYSYKVYIGGPLVSGGGYYVKLDGRDAIYILNNSLSETLLVPVESLVTPLIVYPMQLTTYFNVEDFAVFTPVYRKDDEGQDILDDKGSPTYDLQLDVAFSFIDMAKRSNTLYSAQSFEFSQKYKSRLPALFACDGYVINADRCSDALQCFYTMKFLRCAHVGLNTVTDEQLKEFGLDRMGRVITFDYKLDADGDNTLETTIQYMLMISPKTERGTYYILSPYTDMIVEVLDSYIPFLDWTKDMWLDENFFQTNLAFCTEITIESPSQSITFTLDNSATDQSQTIGSANVRVFANGEELLYNIETTSSTGRPKTVSGVDNFRQFYKAILYASLEGLAGNDLTPEQMQAYRDAGDEGCQLKITIHAVDQATLRNPDNWDENNRLDVVMRFYQYSERRSFMTINGEGEFYMLSSFVEKLMADANRVLNEELIDSTSKY